MPKKKVEVSFFPGYYYTASGVLEAEDGVLRPSQLFCQKRLDVYYYLKPRGWNFSAYVKKKNLDSLFGF